ncbi:MAG TPA: carbohydrate kinase [Clostridia bacterium]|nr:carbohydrate kinase [Clostridia bacterium]
MDAIALGELLIDFVQTGETAQGAPLMAANPGGAPLNYLGALARYGRSCGMVGMVGADAFGRQLQRTLAAYTIAFLGGVTQEAFTTLAFVSLDERGDRSFSFARKPGADTCLKTEDIHFEEIKKARVFHFGTLSLTHEPARSATMEAVRFAKENGVLVSFDPNYRSMLWESPDAAREAMRWGFARADAVKAGADEWELAFGIPARQAAKNLVENGAKLAFVTMGSEGCFFTNGRIERFVPAFQVDVRDTTGAGDIFFGAVMSRILSSGVPVGELSEAQLLYAVRFGAAAAALSATMPGGLPSIAEEADVLALMGPPYEAQRSKKI